VSKKYLPSMAAGFEHPKVKIHVGDGFAFLEDKVDSFDVIITDSSDPVGNVFCFKRTGGNKGGKDSSLVTPRKIGCYSSF